MQSFLNNYSPEQGKKFVKGKHGRGYGYYMNGTYHDMFLGMPDSDGA